MTTERSGMSLESIRDDLRGLAEWPTSVSLGRNQFVQWADAIDAHLSRDAVVSEDGVRSAQDAYEAACGEPCDYFGAEAILKSFAARHGGKHEE